MNLSCVTRHTAWCHNAFELCHKTNCLLPFSHLSFITKYIALCHLCIWAVTRHTAWCEMCCVTRHTADAICAVSYDILLNVIYVLSCHKAHDILPYAICAFELCDKMYCMMLCHTNSIWTASHCLMQFVHLIGVTRHKNHKKICHLSLDLGCLCIWYVSKELLYDIVHLRCVTRLTAACFFGF